MENNSHVLESFWKLEEEIIEAIKKLNKDEVGIYENVSVQQFFGSLNISAHIYSEPVAFESTVPLIVLTGESGRMYFISFYRLFPDIKEKHVKMIKDKEEKK